jgi:hypothetical protein
MQIRISSVKIRELLAADPLDLPPYTSQILNLANQNAQGTRPRVVGQMSELIQEFDGRTLEEWERWYLQRYAERLAVAQDRIRAMVQKLKSAVQLIDDAMIERWVRDLVIVKTFVGLKFQEAILKEISKRMDCVYRLAEAEDEARGIDGYIGQTAISIKPMSYKSKAQLPERLPVCIVYYEKVDNDLRIEFSESDFN